MKGLCPECETMHLPDEPCPATEHTPSIWERKLHAERDRLTSINAELMATLNRIRNTASNCRSDPNQGHNARDRFSLIDNLADAAIAKSKEAPQ